MRGVAVGIAIFYSPFYLPYLVIQGYPENKKDATSAAEMLLMWRPARAPEV